MPKSTGSLQELLSVFERACRDAGLKLTHQRLEIYRELVIATDHPTAELLYHRLRTRLPTISLDTVYRTLATFAGHGLINRVDTAESQGRFEVALRRHHHLVCSRCREIMDFQWNSLEDVPLPEEISSWGRIETRNVVVYGVCNKCRE